MDFKYALQSTLFPCATMARWKRGRIRSYCGHLIVCSFRPLGNHVPKELCSCGDSESPRFTNGYVHSVTRQRCPIFHDAGCESRPDLQQYAIPQEVEEQQLDIILAQDLVWLINQLQVKQEDYQKGKPKP